MPLSVEKASHRWFTEQLNIIRLLDTLDRKHVLHLAYSDLCKDTGGSIARICDFLEIERQSLDHYANVPHHIVGNMMRMGNFAEIRESTDWKEKMSPADIDVYRSVFRQYEKHLARANQEIVAHIWR
jgi:hypothetical protein